MITAFTIIIQTIILRREGENFNIYRKIHVPRGKTNTYIKLFQKKLAKTIIN